MHELWVIICMNMRVFSVKLLSLEKKIAKLVELGKNMARAASVPPAQDPRRPIRPPLPSRAEAHGEATPVPVLFFLCWASCPDSARWYFFQDLRICLFILRLLFYRKPPVVHAYNNSQFVHRIKMIYIWKLLRILSSLIICNFHPCLKCLKCCLH